MHVCVLTRFPKAREKINPAPGHRGSGDGALWVVGATGCNWSATISKTSGVYLDFYVTGLAPNRVNSRGYGLQLRCLSE